MKFTALILIFTLMIMSVVPVCAAAGQSTTEARITRFITEIYANGNDVRVKLNSIPEQFREKVKIKNVNFAKVPDANGDGVCAVEIESAPGKVRTLQVSFKVFTKRQLFMLKQAGQKGDIISKKDIYVRETYMNGKGTDYPPSEEDVVGKALRRDVPANTVVTGQMLESRVVVKRGDIVTIIAENNRLVVQAKGKTVEKGSVGETIRVKNISSGKELMAKVINSSTVKVEF